jgi:hypothetical protein
LKNPKQHVAIEANTQIIKALTKNRDNSGCQFEIFNGTISEKLLDQIQQKFLLVFDTLIVHSEDFITYFIDQNYIQQFKIICFTYNHNKDKYYLYKLGFVRVNKDENNKYNEVYINTRFLPFEILSHYTLHGKIGLFGKL